MPDEDEIDTPGEVLTDSEMIAATHSTVLTLVTDLNLHTEAFDKLRTRISVDRIDNPGAPITIMETVEDQGRRLTAVEGKAGINPPGQPQPATAVTNIIPYLKDGGIASAVITALLFVIYGMWQVFKSHHSG